jgi:hypothetical protein
MKLDSHCVEFSEINIFCLLMSRVNDYIIEFTNEGLHSKGLPPTSAQEFRQFIGTLLLSSAFWMSVENMWNHMNSLTNGLCMTHLRFKQIADNLRGYDSHSQVIDNPDSTWTDQRNKSDQMHTLEMKFFERSVEFFFDSQFGCYVLDNELLASKAADVEYKQLSDRKAGGEGPVSDAVCDAFF